jgi:mono/diheme cytochrome c family protein
VKSPLIFIVGGALVIAAAMLFFFYTGTEPPRPKKETPPNKKTYYDDETLEGPILNKVLGWSLVCAFVIAAALPVYWVTEPQRQVSFAKRYNEQSVERGAVFFSDPKVNPQGFGCAVCHGGVQGGTVRYFLQSGPDAGREVVWQAPSLDDVFYRFSREQVHDILVYGRPNTPMPAWGLQGGGPLTEQMLDDVINYLESVQVSPEEASQKAGSGLGLSGKDLFERNCARCHTQGWSYRYPQLTSDRPVFIGPPGGGAFGPAIDDGRSIRQFPDAEAQVKFISDGSVYGKPYGSNGIGSGRMPGFGKVLTDEEIRRIVEYERSL